MARSWGVDYWSWMFPALMTWAHFPVSLLMKAAKFGVPPPAWLPVSAMAFWTSGSSGCG